jgi:UDP-GlcNAc:undecaprenyl-phosphate/decaprenyl-phosphate GlcNAc-1-phosphate transferase
VFWLLASVANAALVVSLVLTWIVRRLARSRGWMAGPESERHVHQIPLPRLGGVAIFLSVAAVACILIGSGWGSRFYCLALIPTAWMFVVGLIDDLRGLRASWKLLAQLIAAIILFTVGIRIPFGGGDAGLVLSLLATLFWTVTVTNAINLVDGLDGLASGSATCTTLAMLVAALCFGQHDTAILAAALAGAVLGFLCFNVPPATIFLGDSGSLTLGILISAISIRLLQVSTLGWIVCLLALAHPFAEVFISTARRLLTANPIFRPDRRHMHHRLLDRDLSHAQSASTLVAISFAFSCFAMLAVAGPFWALVAIVLASIAGGYVLRAFRYDEFPLFARVLHKVLDHRYTVDAHVQLREVTATLEKIPPESLGELRLLLSELFAGFGFADASLLVPELDRQERSGTSRKGFVLEFPLTTRTERIGTLRIRWDLACPMPIDVGLFAAEFLPALTRSVQWHLEAHREATLGRGFPAQKRQRPRLVAALHQIDPAEIAPLQN